MTLEQTIDKAVKDVESDIKSGNTPAEVVIKHIASAFAAYHLTPMSEKFPKESLFDFIDNLGNIYTSFLVLLHLQSNPDDRTKLQALLKKSKGRYSKEIHDIIMGDRSSYTATIKLDDDLIN